MSYSREYAEKFLIAYIGNKRRLLPLIQKAIEALPLDEKKEHTFVDFFSGSGSVARFAKSAGFKVIANDWEQYSCIINRAFVEMSGIEIENLFADEGGLDRVLKHLNSLPSPARSEEYIARYYCPKNDKNPDLDRERLFYTRENGLIIDAVRNYIEKKYGHAGEKNRKKKIFLTALLIYYASRHSNTSGVFKGFHRGFGGSGADALERILARIVLEKPVLDERTGKVYCSDALKLARKLSKTAVDIAYLDPPYNQHQYGSNYHLLNTIALWDKLPVNESFIIDGKKTAKSAIRSDWIKTKSSYCYVRSAAAEFRSLVEKINSRFILTSYSTEGIIPFDVMLDILSRRGKIGIVTSGYTRFRGGRQTVSTKSGNIEFILLTDTQKKSTVCDLENVRRVLLAGNLSLAGSLTFPAAKVSTSIVTRIKDGRIHARLVNQDLEFTLNRELQIENLPVDVLQKYSFKELDEIYRELSAFMTLGADREIKELLKILRRAPELVNDSFLLKRAGVLFRKINYKRYPESFTVCAQDMIAFLHEFAYNNTGLRSAPLDALAAHIRQACEKYKTRLENEHPGLYHQALQLGNIPLLSKTAA